MTTCVQQRWHTVAVALVTALSLSACSDPRVEPLMPTPELFTAMKFGPLDHIPEDQRWKPRRVYFATTRQREPDLQRIDYGNLESPQVSVGLSLIGFGGPDISWSDLNEYSRNRDRPEIVDLSIAGIVEAGHFTVSDEGRPRDSNGAAAWLLADLNASIRAARDKDLLVYVHGAKVNFYNANAFAAQLDHFMGRDMTSLAFSWPTRQNIIAYGAGGDVRRAYRSAPALSALLEALGRGSVARRIHIVCWSAGGRVVTAALKQLHERHAGSDEDLRKRLRIGTVYYAAADVPSKEFLDSLPAINALASRIVVTESSADDALNMASRVMRDGSRIGQQHQGLSADQMAIVRAADRLEVIDVSRGSEDRGFDITGHRYWISHPWASSDVVLAVRSDLDPEDRALEPTEFGFLWGIPSNYPARLRELRKRPDLNLRRNN